MRRRFLTLLALFFSLPLINHILYRRFRGPRPAIIQIAAHRGGAALAPENTAAAFRNAARIGADWIEFDVHRTEDGVLVIMHDDTVNRMTNGKGYIRDMTWEQLQQLRVVNGEMILTFGEVIAIAQETGIGILPELKSMHYAPGMEYQALEMVQRAGYIHKTIFLSFDHQALAHIKAQAPDVRVASLYNFTLSIPHPEPADANIIAPMAEMVLLNPWIIHQAHAQGREVWVWFGALDAPWTYRLLMDLGVDALICNDPVTALRLARRAGRHPQAVRA